MTGSRFLRAALAAGCVLAARAEPPVLVELFTSEGCSSCPPADQLLADLAKRAGVIVLSEHVNYWDRLGWVDPFAAEPFGARQRTYASRFQERSVYTPQMVVDGREGFTGSDRDHALRAIATAARQPKAAVTISRAPSQGTGGVATFTVRVAGVPSQSLANAPEVVLAITEGRLHSQVLRGENQGRSLEHTAVVRKLEVLGRMDPGASAFSATPELQMDPAWNRDHLQAVVFVQAPQGGRILGAAAVAF